MADKSAIEWTDATWNPTVGCSIVSPGCTNCYAMKQAHDLVHRFGSEKYSGLTKVVNGNPVWLGRVVLDERALLQPLKWKRGRHIFVNSMSDLFHEALSDADIDRVFAVMALCPQHTFQVLTKRAERMREYLEFGKSFERFKAIKWKALFLKPKGFEDRYMEWPLSNVWIGVSAERQEEADERIPDLLATPAAIRFLSAEPLLGPIDLTRIELPTHALCDALSSRRDGAYVASPATLDWVIVGGESGKSARRMDARWARDIRDQCSAADVPFFFKQWGEHDPETFDRVGKKAAGRLLDGRENNAFPVTDVSEHPSGAASHDKKQKEAVRA